MDFSQLQPGDMVFAAADIVSDGDVPGYPDGALIAAAGARGVLINTGHYEEYPDDEFYLVRFEDAQGELGFPVGCWPEELTLQTEPAPS
ncbi:MAG: nitrogen fixation protein NifZ [Candidatus Thiothrix singaporensis]|uniref:Nitrogen fixation protein NifZ n=1 Tax=Candidatus Thiothrix singaporensis TaxID=2799669 RepID=A0A7L6ARA7_9GAMM|nr:MAG: nitrogen fixation protein NifZ [Candidatus Thiothrix singaporensis]